MGGEGRKLPAGQPRHLSTASKQISLSRVITSRACKAHLFGDSASMDIQQSQSAPVDSYCLRWIDHQRHLG